MAKTKKEVGVFEASVELTRKKLVEMGVALISMAVGDTFTLEFPKKEGMFKLNLVIERVRGRK